MKAIVLIGHGGVPKDFPRDKVKRLIALESERQRLGTQMSQEERELDAEIRNWPRNKENDPYQHGMEQIADSLKKRVGETTLRVAYNEFCGPSVEDASEKLIDEGYDYLVFVSTMFTPGGVHSEFEIPEIVEDLKKKFPTINFEYKWPYNLDLVSGFLATQVDADNPQL